MKTRKMLLVVSIIMLVTALPLSFFIFHFLEPPHYITEANPEEALEMPNLTEGQSKQEAGRMVGAASHLLLIPAGIAGVAERKKNRCIVSEILAGFLVAAGLFSFYYMEGSFLIAFPAFVSETVFYCIGIKKDKESV